MEAKEIADMLNIDIHRVQKIIVSGKEKLLKERDKRKAPFIDISLYTSLNGMLITAYLKAYRILKDKYLKEFALKSLKRIMEINIINNELFHTKGVKALLDDYIYFIDALIAAYEVTGDITYLNMADKQMERCLEKFQDNDGGFFDTGEEVIGLRLKVIEDIPHPSANSLGIILLLKLSYMTNRNLYQEYAEKALKSFSLKAYDMGIHAGYYLCATDAYFHMIRLTVESSPESELTESALSFSVPYMSIMHGEDRGQIVPCFKNVCYEPIKTSNILKDFLMNKYPALKA
jgi:uncharacterized protein YyaL (SSP411 family)